MNTVCLVGIHLTYLIHLAIWGFFVCSFVFLLCFVCKGSRETSLNLTYMNKYLWGGTQKNRHHWGPPGILSERKSSLMSLHLTQAKLLYCSTSCGLYKGRQNHGQFIGILGERGISWNSLNWKFCNFLYSLAQAGLWRESTKPEVSLSSSSWDCPEATFCPVLHHVCGHTGGKPAHHSGHPLWHSAPDTYVFFPQHLILHWCLLHNNHCSQDASELPVREEVHLLCWVYDQMYFFSAFANTESYLLAAMAIDHFVAICDPFHYVTIMSHHRCVLLLVFSCSISDLHSLLLVLLINHLTFCNSNVIPHFLCDINPLLKLSCSSTFVTEVVINTEGLVILVTPFICIIISYFRILIAVLQIPSVAGQRKAFSTCGSHLTMVTLFYGSIIYVYFRPLSSYTFKDRVATVIYMVLSSMLKPLIYSLRNKDMKWGMRKLMGRRRSQAASSWAHSGASLWALISADSWYTYPATRG